MRWRRSPAGLLLAGLLLAGGCGTAPAPVRFVPGPVVTAVADTLPIPLPAEREFYRVTHHIENFALRQARLHLDGRPSRPALDVNRLGEVPASSWYRPRLPGLTAADVGRGAGGADPGPEAFFPWRILGMKHGGRNPGFVFADARGVRYICKFDKPGEPVVATAAGAVANRLLWALGYHVPDDRVVLFRRDQLRVAPGATYKRHGSRRPLRERDIDALLARLPQARRGDHYRALVSRLLDGRPVGGFAYTGVRPDDPNDVIPHERRRSLRALRVFGAWLNHVDLKEDNTLDLYVGEPGRGHLVHYLVDFDGCLGGYWAARHEARIGYAHDIDLEELALGIVTLGLRVRPYEDLPPPPHPELGLFLADPFDPGHWVPNYANDWLHACDPADAFWAGRMLARVTDDMIAAAVAAGRYEDPRAAELLQEILVKRRDRTVTWALQRVSPAVALAPADPTGEALRVPARDALAGYMGRSLLTWTVTAAVDGGPALAVIQAGAAPAVALDDLPATDGTQVTLTWTARRDDGRVLPPTRADYRRRRGRWELLGILRAGR